MGNLQREDIRLHTNKAWDILEIGKILQGQ